MLVEDLLLDPSIRCPSLRKRCVYRKKKMRRNRTSKKGGELNRIA